MSSPKVKKNFVEKRFTDEEKKELRAERKAQKAAKKAAAARKKAEKERQRFASKDSYPDWYNQITVPQDAFEYTSYRKTVFEAFNSDAEKSIEKSQALLKNAWNKQQYDVKFPESPCIRLYERLCNSLVPIRQAFVEKFAGAQYDMICVSGNSLCFRVHSADHDLFVKVFTTVQIDRTAQEISISKRLTGELDWVPKFHSSFEIPIESEKALPVLVTNFVNGSTLVCDQSNATAIAIELGKKLIQLHKQRVVHRDIKPGNIMHTLDGDVVFIDFGLAFDGGVSDVRGITHHRHRLGNSFYVHPKLDSSSSVDEKRQASNDVAVMVGVLFFLHTGLYPLNLQLFGEVVDCLLPWAISTNDDRVPVLTFIRDALSSAIVTTAGFVSQLQSLIATPDNNDVDEETLKTLFGKLTTKVVSSGAQDIASWLRSTFLRNLAAASKNKLLHWKHNAKSFKKRSDGCYEMTVTVNNGNVVLVHQLKVIHDNANQQYALWYVLIDDTQLYCGRVSRPSLGKTFDVEPYATTFTDEIVSFLKRA